MNEQTIVSGDEASLSMGTLLENMEGAHLTGTLRKEVEESSGDGSFSLQVPVGEPGESVD
jgi:hypothetical protein